MKRVFSPREFSKYIKSFEGKTISLYSEVQKNMSADSLTYRLTFSEINVYDIQNIITLRSVDNGYVDFHFVTRVLLSKTKQSDDLYIECFRPSERVCSTYHLVVS